MEKDPSEQAIMHAREPDSAGISRGKVSTNYKENVMFDPFQKFSSKIGQPYPKTGSRNMGTAIKRNRRAAILTDTPEKTHYKRNEIKQLKQLKNNNKD